MKFHDFNGAATSKYQQSAYVKTKAQIKYSASLFSLCGYWIDTMSLLSKSENSSFYLFSMYVQPGLCQTWSETQIVVFNHGMDKFSIFRCDRLM